MGAGGSWKNSGEWRRENVDPYSVVIVRLDRTIQYSGAPVMEAKGCGVLDTPLSRSMTTQYEADDFHRNQCPGLWVSGSRRGRLEVDTLKGRRSRHFPLPPKRFMVPCGLASCKAGSSIDTKAWQETVGIPRPLEGGLTRYISTRGEAPALGFCDVMLTGLARDGGLYVPETWPQLSPATIAGFFGRPYWEVTVEIIRPFVGGEISDADLGRMANEAYATFRHPAVVPLDQIGPNQFTLELFHGPTLAFKDVAMQLISRLMDHVLAKRPQAIPGVLRSRPLPVSTMSI